MLKDGSKEYLAVADKDDPLLRLLTPRFLVQRGEDPSNNTEAASYTHLTLQTIHSGSRTVVAGSVTKQQ